jgi:Fe-S cluster assembly ATP-binding protein
MSKLIIRNLFVDVFINQTERKTILQGVNLTIESGQVHALMGPNGSGKSTLAYALAGHPNYQITQGEIWLDDAPLHDLRPDQRAQAGLFLAMQYPVEIDGVSLSSFLRAAKTALDQKPPPLREWAGNLNQAMTNLGVERDFAGRAINVGFSGGEKKRVEILQLEMLRPKIAILDETDSGLDVDALKTVAESVNRSLAATKVGILLITHYTRILNYIKPDYVHVFANGRIAESGGPELAELLEAKGYQDYQ